MEGVVGLLITKLGKIYAECVSEIFLIGKYLAKLQAKTWLATHVPGPNLIHVTLGPPESTIQSVQPLL